MQPPTKRRSKLPFVTLGNFLSSALVQAEGSPLLSSADVTRFNCHSGDVLGICLAPGTAVGIILG